MSKSMARLGLTSFLDGFAMGGLFHRSRWFGAPVLGFAPSRTGHALSDKPAAAELDREQNRLIADLRSCLNLIKEEDEARAAVARAQAQLEAYLREREASDLSTTSAARSFRK
jgi:hypothetical protein